VAEGRPPDPAGPPPETAGRAARRSTRTSREARTAAEIRVLARDRLIESRLTPNTISLTGLALNVVAAVLVTQRLFVLAGLAFAIGSVMDTLDGRYSRMSGKGTAFGAFLDSTLDRVEEGIVLTAVAAYFAALGDDLAAGAVVVCVIGSYMVSYVRARAEALGVECKVGLATRPVRVVILGVGLFFGQGAIIGIHLLEPTIYFLAALTAVTALQRVLHVRSALRRASQALEPEAPGAGPV
jgi:CDP-diacylglycerol---glycerol-3-phosphate 3-phosphatidyltransferase